MTEIQANILAEVDGGYPWHPMSNLWLVVVPRDDGTAVIFDDDAVVLYADEAAFDAGEALVIIEIDP